MQLSQAEKEFAMAGFTIPQESSVAILKRFELLLKSEALNECRVTVNTNIKDHHFPDSPGSQSITAALKACESHPGLTVSSISVTFTRGNRPSIRFERNEKDPVDKLELQNAQNDSDLQVLTAIESTFEFTTRGKAIIDALPGDLQSRFEMLRDAQSVLDQQAAKLSSILTEHTKTVLDRDREARLQIGKELEVQRTELEAEFKARNERLLQFEQSLNGKEHELKRLEHRGVRRSMLKELVEDLSLSFKPSSQTKNQNWIVHLVFMAFMAILGSCLLSFMNLAKAGLDETSIPSKEALTSQNGNAASNLSTQTGTSTSTLMRANWFYYMPVASCFLVMVTTGIFYTRWIRSVYSMVTSFDYEAIRYKRDILRANWLAELMLEAKNPTREGAEPLDLPDALLAQFSNRLFEIHRESTAEHPLEQLQRYAKQFKKLTVGPVTMESPRERSVGTPDKSN